MICNERLIAIPPSATILEQLKNRNMTQKQLGSHLELSDEKMSLLMKGKLELTQDIADQLEDEIDEKISSYINILEPTLVIILSIIVGVILLSVMLPLLGIMSNI